MIDPHSTTLIHTRHSTFLCVRNKSAFAHSANDKDFALSELNIHFCEGTPFALIQGNLDTCFSLSPKGPKSHTHVVKIFNQWNGSFAVLDLWSRQFLSARTPSQTHGQLELRDVVKEWELFRSNARVALPESLSQLYTYLAKEAVTANDILEVLSLNTGEAAQRLISVLLPLLSLAETTILGRHLLTDPAICLKLQEIFKNDIWINHALPLLYARNGVDNTLPQKSRRRLVDRSFDPLGQAGKQGQSEGTGYALNAMARRSVVPDKSACLVATARNEGIYLLEWVAYHRALGFEEIIIYSNNNTDSSDLILAALADAGEIIWCNNEIDPRCDAQGKAYSHALTVMPETLAHEWCAFVDIDEFICINSGLFGSLSEFLQWHGRRQIDAIAMNWVYFGSNGKASWDDAPITQRLTARRIDADPHIKSMFRPHNVISSQPHFPRESERHSLLFRGSDSELHTFSKSSLNPRIAKALSDRPQATHAFVAHYFFKTCEEFLWKFSRNRGDYKMSESDITLTLEARFLKGFLNQFNDGAQYQTITSGNRAFEATHQRLLDNHEIADASSKVKRAFRERSKRVLDAYRPFLMEEMGEDGRAFLRILDKK